MRYTEYADKQQNSPFSFVNKLLHENSRLFVKLTADGHQFCTGRLQNCMFDGAVRDRSDAAPS
jgi:hypothetical protein